MDRKKNKLLKRIVVFMALVLICFNIVPMYSISASENDEWKTIKISCGINKALYFNEDGEIDGYCKTYLLELAKINHWNLEYVQGSWTESVQNLYDGKIDILLPTQITDERIGKMGFSTSIGGYQPIGLVAKSDSEWCFDDFDSFNGAKIAVSKGTSNEQELIDYAKENNFSYEPVYLDSVEDKLKALEEGNVDLIVFSTLNDVGGGKVVAMLDYLPFYYCTRIDDDELLDELNFGMNQMIIRHADTVQNVFYSFMNKNISFAYTREEMEAISRRGKIVVGVYNNTAPLFDVSSDGSYSGIYLDLINRISEISGLEFEIKVIDRKNYAFDVLKNGEIDFILGSSSQALEYAGDSEFAQSEGVMDYYSVDITRNDYVLSNEGRMTFALTGGRKYWQSILEDTYPNANFVYYESTKDCLDAVQSRRADVTILNSWEFNYQSKNQKFANLIELETTRSLTATVFVSLESENALIRSVIDKSIEQISNAEKEAIITANLNVPYNSYSFWDKIYEARGAVIAIAFVLILAGVVFGVYSLMRKKSLKELEEKNEQLESANDAKNVFLSRMSHELRTPLNAISGYATVMEQNLDGNRVDVEKSKADLEAILRATKYQLAIISDLLDIQKIESGKMELVPIKVDAEDYIENIIEMIKPEAEAKNIQFTYDRLSSTAETYYIDAVRVQQVLLNLLHNAVKFTPKGGKVRLTARTVSQKDDMATLEFRVIDNGIGISEEFQEKGLFRSFAQEFEGTTSPYEGCGTGLAISKEIIDLMGGTIKCTSKRGEGSTFIVTITARFEDKKTEVGTHNNKIRDLSNLNILLCEDNEMNQKMEKMILERMKCNVDLAVDGVDGVEKFKNSKPGTYNAVLMDIRMPNMDGLEATRQIRAMDREDAKKVAIIAVSANAFAEDVQKSLDAGMNDHIPKPIDVKKLYESICRFT